jgi:hypothetical protein
MIGFLIKTVRTILGFRDFPEPNRPINQSSYQGYIDELSVNHIAGWARDLANPNSRVEVEIILPESEGEKVIRCVRANEFSEVLAAVGVGDGTYSFYVQFPNPLSESDREKVFARVSATQHRLEFAPELKTQFEPIHHIAMDIVNNCNLRCSFCVYDYSYTNKTSFMNIETFDSVLRLIPYVRDGNFWLSCLHEATLHPKLIDFIERVPSQYRKKLFYTTNLAKRMPDSYFAFLANSGVSHINISLESLDPKVYENMRKGARFKIFKENWDKLLAANSIGSAPPRIRYNVMAYKSNLYEIPELVALLLKEKAAWQVEVRNTFDEPHIPQSFRDSEFLESADWAWLQEKFRNFSVEQVLLLIPPGGIGYDKKVSRPSSLIRQSVSNQLSENVFIENPDIIETRPQADKIFRIPRPFNLQVTWDGTLNVYGENPRRPNERQTHNTYFTKNILLMSDPIATLLSLE